MTALKEQDEGPIINEPQQKGPTDEVQRGRWNRFMNSCEREKWRQRNQGNCVSFDPFCGNWMVGLPKSGDDLTKSFFSGAVLFFAPLTMMRKSRKWRGDTLKIGKKIFHFCFVNNNQQTTIICLSFGFSLNRLTGLFLGDRWLGWGLNILRLLWAYGNRGAAKVWTNIGRIRQVWTGGGQTSMNNIHWNSGAFFNCCCFSGMKCSEKLSVTV
jgi:hypothetical protein